MKLNKDVARLLNEKAQEVAVKFSDPNRSRNSQAETFLVSEIVPLSEYVAAVTFWKSSEKKAIAFFYWVNSGEGYWAYFFPSDSHILGMQIFGEHKWDVEKFNFSKNFEPKA